MNIRQFLYGPVVYGVIQSLENRPIEWTDDIRQMKRPYRITHKNGAVLWVANDVWGLHIEEPGGRTVWGGVAALWFFYPARWALISAVKRWLRRCGTKENPLVDLKL